MVDVSVSTGSIVVDVSVRSMLHDVDEIGTVLNDLQRQVHDPTSPLRAGFCLDP